MKQKLSVWVLEAESGGQWLFHGNPNPGLPPYHLEGIEGIVRAGALVHDDTRYGLGVSGAEKVFNLWADSAGQKSLRVHPRHVTIEARDYGGRPTTRRPGGRGPR